MTKQPHPEILFELKILMVGKDYSTKIYYRFSQQFILTYNF
jgi:hypothetical protein